MFSFHKPKVYRSTAGCCICKAKSSSSRFTDSKKYETDFIQCFQLEIPRRGEICNACVLLVKRFKRLPPGSGRHWGHVVDARTGPGLKSMTKFKKRKEELDSGIVKEPVVADRFNKIFKKTKKKPFKKETSSLGGSSDESPPSPTESQHSDDYEDGIFQKKFFSYSTRAQQQKNLKRQEAAQKLKMRRKNPHPKKSLRYPANHFNLFTDVVSHNELWQQKSTCCGAIYECADFQAVIINVASFKPCRQHQQMSKGATSSSSASSLSSSSASSPTTIQPQSLPQQQIAPLQQHTSTAIKKHQLFLKRHSEPSSTSAASSIAKPCDTISSSNVKEFSNINDKTEKMDTTEMGRKDNVDIKYKLNDDKKNGAEKVEIDGSNVLLLQEMNHQEGVKLMKPLMQQINHSLSSVIISGDKMSMLKYKLANMARFGGLGNDNSSDSGYEEVVQDGSKLLMPQMPPPPVDVLQSL